MDKEDCAQVGGYLYRNVKDIVKPGELGIETI
jgi:hypothetical protein